MALLAGRALLHVVPVSVDLDLHRGEKPGVLRLEEVLEPALRLEELLDRLLVGDLGRDAPLAVFHLEERPEARLDRGLGDLDGRLRLAAPAARTRREDVDEGGTANAFSAFAVRSRQWLTDACAT